MGSGLSTQPVSRAPAVEIQTLPEEILAEILLYCIGDKPPSRALASVCKDWKSLILRVPALWRNLEAFLVYPGDIGRQAHALQRRIDLSCSTLLDVTLSLGYEFYGDSSLFELIAQTGIERWRSLKLKSQLVSHTIFRDGFFKGTFSALQKLEFNYSYDDGFKGVEDPFIPIYHLIDQSRPPLRDITLFDPLPECLSGTIILQQVTRITASPTAFLQLPPINNLEHLQLVGFDRHYDFSSLTSLPLPPTTEFVCNLTKEQLLSLPKQKVKYLKISSLEDISFNGDIAFPELITLSILNDGLSGITDLVAPRLTSLEMRMYQLDFHSDIEKKHKDTSFILRECPDRIKVKPTSLTIDLPFPASTTFGMLQLWPQLEHLIISFGLDVSWSRDFPDALSRKKNPLCPELIDLRLDLSSDDFGRKKDQWIGIAKSILSARRRTRLKTIMWRSKDGGWEILSTQDTAS